MDSLLGHIDGPEDLKRLALEQLPHLATEIRQALLARFEQVGGHVGPNLGVVEATIALHYVFNSPVDKIVFDVSHQCYTHKILTGRRTAYTDPSRYLEVSGFTNPEESPHDIFSIGHSSTATSLALGLAKARDLQGESYEVITFVGDGALSGGEAYEGLDNAAAYGGKFIIVLNDNDMSIAPNQGGLYGHLAKLRHSKGSSSENIFKELGFDYLYVEDGHDISALVSAFQAAREANTPIVVHIHTTKGKGHPEAEVDREAWHEIKLPQRARPEFKRLMSSITDQLLERMHKDPSIVLISPGTPSSQGITPEFREQAGTQFVDVGITEEHSVAFISGLARGGAKPVLAIASTFLQRTYDQLLQDLALNSSPATILVYASGFTQREATHCGMFDIAMTSSIPNLLCLAPATQDDCLAMIDWSLDQQERPVLIRIPTTLASEGNAGAFDDKQIGRFHVVNQGARVAIIGLGSAFSLALMARDELSLTAGINATLINPLTYSQLDEELLFELEGEHDVVVTIESGVLDGGFGERIARFYGTRPMRVVCMGGDKEFTERVAVTEQLERYGLTPEAMCARILEALES
ncbi:MAG: 1-deoxy-D-xylulose-5-phosphate synthase [Atopobiaceae bacterium]|nr:1-deoxy-D-xylulose-5-phosphate synthase [Atopobiaceae bacterium]